MVKNLAPSSFLLTAEIAHLAIEAFIPTFEMLWEKKVVVRGDLHIVVVDPACSYSPGVSFDSAVLFQQSIGVIENWEYPYDKYAYGKARATWRTGLPTHYIQQLAPHLFVEGDTRHAGSAIVDGIIVGCSGVQGHFDRTCAENIATLCRDLCINQMKSSWSDHDSPDFFG